MPEPRFRLNPSVLREFPPGGWIYRQPETQWRTPAPLVNNFAATVEQIARHRKANPQYAIPHDTETVALDLEEFTAKRILSEAPNMVHKWLLPMNGEAAEKKKPSPPPAQPPLVRGLVAALAHAVNRLRRDARGLRILNEWFGLGAVPVSSTLAIARAETCSHCPNNVAGYQIEASVAEAIRAHVEVKRNLKLSTPHDVALHTCNLCGCHLPLKVWVPLSKAKSDYPDVEFPNHCWVQTERTSKQVVSIRRAGAFGDVIAASVIADHLADNGYSPVMVCDPIPSVVLKHHPRIRVETTDKFREKADVNLDLTYEVNHDISSRHVIDLFWESTSKQLKSRGVTLATPTNWLPDLRVTDTELANARARMMPRTGVPRIAFIPRSAAWANRTVPNSTWIDVARGIGHSAHCYWVSNHEFPGEPFLNPNIRSFRETMGVIAECDLVVSVDTGPMHVAAALRKPILAVLQSFRIDLRLTDHSDWQEVGANLDCLGCCKYFCPISKDSPPCSAIAPGTIVSGIRSRLKALDTNRIAAVIPSYNTKFARLQKCVDAIRGQVSEIIIAVDGDARLEFKDKDVTVVQNPYKRRTGFGRTCARGARASNSGWILFLNDDCYMDPGSIAQMHSCADERTAVVGCLLRYPDGRIQHGGVKMGADGLTWGHRDMMQRRPSVTTIKEDPGVTFASALVRRKAYYDVGGFDFRYDVYCEDSDLCKSIRDNGWKILYNPHATGIHEESQTMSATKSAALAESHKKLFAKWNKT